MKKIFLLVPVFLLLMITGCSEKSSDNVTDYKGERISLQANIGAITRGDGVISEGTSALLLNVSLIRLDKDETSYANEPLINGTIDRAENEDTGTSILTLNPNVADAYYPADKNQSLQLIAWYPRGESNDAGTISFPDGTKIDGTTDVLATTLVSGKLKDASLASSAITFHHLLSQIVVKVAARDEDVREAWGDLKSIEIQGREQAFTLILPVTETEDGPSAVEEVLPIINILETPAPTNLVLLSLESDSEMVLPVLPTTPAAAGYALIAPTSTVATESLVAEGKEELKLIIETTKKTVTVTVTEKFEAEKAYTITLTFAQYVSIEVEKVNLVTPWPAASDVSTGTILGYPGFDSSDAPGGVDGSYETDSSI
ncbi:hypothetical protein EZS27_002422 [termite gut metagenome]|uniref:Fimbrillin family protein n=1 Tax=termite gut metagenome TaxID=433724 RepID=A0A5J4SVB9_9ZZZZ